jgi:hypothetical protein
MLLQSCSATMRDDRLADLGAPAASHDGIPSRAAIAAPRHRAFITFAPPGIRRCMSGA